MPDESPTPDAPARADRAPRAGGVQSIARAFGLLELLADAGGRLTLSQLAVRADLPVATIHRLVRTLVELGYLRQEPSRQYALGPRLIHLGEVSTQMLDAWAQPYLADLVAATGESANLAVLQGDEVVYVGQEQSTRSMRMFTEVGRHVLPHCTAVGKAMLAELARSDRAAVTAVLARTGMPRHTEHTITDEGAFLAELEVIAERGYAVDEQEQELGVRCVAVTVPTTGARMGLSVSGPLTRMDEEVLAATVPRLRSAAAALAADLAGAARPAPQATR